LAEQKEMKTDKTFLSHFFLVLGKLGKMVAGILSAGCLENAPGQNKVPAFIFPSQLRKYLLARPKPVT